MPVYPPKITTPAFIIKFTFTFTLGSGEKVGTSLYHKYSSSGARPTVANLQSLATAAGTAWGANCKALFTSNGVLASVTAQDIYDTSGAVGVSTIGTAGTRAGSQPVTFACANVGYTILQHYRGGKPKGFWPYGIASDAANQSDWSAGFVSAVNTAQTALAGAINGSTAGPITMGIQEAVSFFKGATNNPAAGAWKRRNIPLMRAQAVIYDVSGWSCATKIASQRRRRV